MVPDVDVYCIKCGRFIAADVPDETTDEEIARIEFYCGECWSLEHPALTNEERQR